MKPIRAFAWVLMAGTIASGCSVKDSSKGADSLAALDSASARDSAAMRDSVQAAYSRVNDSLAAAAGAAASTAGSAGRSTTGTIGETRKSGYPARSNPPEPSRGRIIGRDSMTMPVGTIDSMGKITKIKRDN